MMGDNNINSSDWPDYYSFYGKFYRNGSSSNNASVNYYTWLGLYDSAEVHETQKELDLVGYGTYIDTTNCTCNSSSGLWTGSSCSVTPKYYFYKLVGSVNFGARPQLGDFDSTYDDYDLTNTSAHYIKCLNLNFSATAAAE